MKAVIIKEQGKAALAEVKEQSMRLGYIKVKTVAVACNPTDYHHTAGVGLPGGILGCDFSGIVEEVGPDCKSTVKKGNAVFGVCHGANNNNSEDGAFAEYTMVRDGHLAPILNGISFESAATLGVAITTIGQTLYMMMKLPLPDKPAEKPFPILIYGGSTATGTTAIQFAKLSGLTVITTCSPKNFELVKSRGADFVVDYNDPDCGSKIRSYTQNSLYYILDTISTPSSYAICANSFPPLDDGNMEKLKLVSVLPLEGWERGDVDARPVLAYTTFGEAFTKFGMEFPGLEENYRFGVGFWEFAAKLLAEGKILPHPARVGEGGLGGVVRGITDVGTGKVRGEKLVYRVAETGDVGEDGSGEGEAGLKATLTKW